MIRNIVHSLLRWQVRVNVVRSRIIYPNACRNPAIGLERRSVNDAAKLDTISATLLHSYRCAVSRNERHYAATAPQSAEMQGSIYLRSDRMQGGRVSECKELLAYSGYQVNRNDTSSPAKYSRMVYWHSPGRHTSDSKM